MHWVKLETLKNMQCPSFCEFWSSLKSVLGGNYYEQ